MARRKYGYDFPDEFSDVQIELTCYLQNPKKGLGRAAHLRNAMQMLWPTVYAGEISPGVPRWRPEIDAIVQAWCSSRVIVVLGHASAGKTHTLAHVAMASYLADANNTIVTLTSTHLPGLKRRLWADVCSAANSSILGRIFQIRSHDLVLRPMGSIEEKYVVAGIATDKAEAAVEKIQGNHSRNHQFLIIDEAQGTPTAIFDAAANLMTDPDFKMVLLANPREKLSEFGSWCEPKDGWNSIDPDTDFVWEIKRGGVAIRLDGLKSPNIAANKVLFPFLIRPEYIEQIRRSYGEGSARWWMYVRGWFPPEGLVGRVFPENVLARAYALVDYKNRPRKCAALDPAFEGGDECSLVLGSYGNARGSDFCLQVDEVRTIKVAVSAKSDPLDYLIAREVKRICEAEGVAPEDFIVDNTAAGRGVCAILQSEWSPLIRKCYFGGRPTQRKVKVGDDRTAEELFDRFVTEIWFAARAWMEEGMVGGLDDRFKQLKVELSARLYETIGEKKDSVETKREMKERIGYSPDRADALCMLVELLRQKGGAAGAGSVNRGGALIERLFNRAKKYSSIYDKEFSHR